jgi:thioredoxin 1
MNMPISTSRRRGKIICLGVLAGTLSISGCANNRAARDTIADGMRMSQSPTAAPSIPPQLAVPRQEAAEAMIASNRAKDLYPSAYLSMRPDGENLALPDASIAAAQSPPVPAWPIAEAPKPADTSSSFSQPSYPPVRLVSEERPSLPVQSTTPRLPAGPLARSRAEPRPAGSPAVPTVLHANEATFEQHVLHSDVAVLVDFYAIWCAPCKSLAPTLEEVAAENPKARIVKVDIDDSPELAARYGVKSVPSLLVFKDGQVVAKQKGIVGKARLMAMLDL